MKKIALVLLLSLGAAATRAQTADPSPLLNERAVAATTPAGWMVQETRAGQAQQAGFPATATAIYRELLHDTSMPAEARQRISLALVTALMDAGEAREAETALQSYDGPRNTAYQLRAGLLAANARRFPQAKAALAAGKPDELGATDRGWWHFLQALVADAENELDRRNAAFEQANRTTVSELQRSRFALGLEQMRLRTAPATEAQLATARGNMDRLQGTRPGNTWVRTYAVALASLGRASEAQNVLQRQLDVLPPTERDTADQFRLLLGLIAGEGSEAGRRAFRDLLRNGQKPETQRLALQLLARGTKTAPEREQLRRDFSELLNGPVMHPVIEDLLLVRAQAALADKLYPSAEEDARALLDRFPGSTLRPAALGVRLTVAWELKRYRTAADVIAQLRATLPPGRERTELGVLLAEAFFRSEDYRNAADAYDAARREAPQTVPAGVLIFQRVLANIRAGQLDAAAQLLDDLAASPAFDTVNRWQAEWNLVKEMQVRGLSTGAYARVNRLLQAGAAGVPAELRVRLMWLRAKLSYDNGQPDETLRQTEELQAALAGAAGLEPALHTEVASTAQLLTAQALLALGRDDAGGALLDKLRADHRGTKAAVYSYIVQAARATARGETVKAQQLLIKLADEHRESEFAPLALYEAALNAERRGLDDHLREAYTLLERLVHDYPRDDLVFHARLKQGNLLRKLNDFGAARQFYESLVNNFAQHPDVLLAHLALADSLFAQGGNSVANYESAAAIFERLRDLPSAPLDLRAEAGFKWGYALEKRAQPAKAQTVFWSVVDAFLLDPGLAARLGAKGRYWVARTLLELGQLHEDAGRLDEAQRAYQLIVDNQLGGAAQAQAKLARFRATEVAK